MTNTSILSAVCFILGMVLGTIIYRIILKSSKMEDKDKLHTRRNWTLGLIAIALTIIGAITVLKWIWQAID